MKIKKVLMIGLPILALAGAGFYFWKKRQGSDEEEESVATAAPSRAMAPAAKAASIVEKYKNIWYSGTGNPYYNIISKNNEKFKVGVSVVDSKGRKGKVIRVYDNKNGHWVVTSYVSTIKSKSVKEAGTLKTV